MKFTMTQIAAGVAGLVLGAAATGARAAAVTGMTLGDTLTLAGVPGSDGYSGAFRFGPLASQATTGASLFAGDVNGGVINVNAANAPDSFTTGFIFAGSAFQPDTTGAIDIDITGTTMTVNSLPWGGYYTGASFQFNMPPDAAPTYTLVQTSATDYAFRMKFSHYITSQDDPSLQYAGFNAYWILEGAMSTAPVPEASTYGMMLVGLGLVGMAVRRRRSVMS